MFVVYLMLFSVVYTIPRRYNYNCFSLYAELFPIKEFSRSYGNRTFQLREKDYDDFKANIPKYEKKIKETELSLTPIPENRKSAEDEYQNFKWMLFDRAELPDFDESAEDGFKNKMKVRQYYQKLLEYVGISFLNLVNNDPIDWLDIRNVVYRYISNSVTSNYIQMSRLRPSKDTSITDYCTQLAMSIENDHGWGKGTAKNAFELVFRCYDIFPYNGDAAKKYYDLVLLMAEFYVFSNYTTNGVGTGDIFKKLKEQTLQFDSSLHFNEYFGRSVNAMKDAHISYKVDCYEQFTFIQPIYIQHLSQDGYPLGVYITKVNAPELQRWVGAEVLQVDGWFSDYRIIDYGKELGKSHYFKSRFTLGCSRYFFDSNSQDFLIERGLYLKRTTIPKRSYLIYTLKIPDLKQFIEIKVDWRVYKNPTVKTFDDQYSYWYNHCEAEPLKRIGNYSPSALQKRSAGAVKTYNSNVKRRLHVQNLQKRSDATANYKATIDGTIPIIVGPGFAFFVLNDSDYGDYGVLIIQTFDVADTNSWFKNMRIGFKALMDKGITRLMLDLTGNSGGVLCLAYSLLGVLSPSPTYPFPATEFSYGTRARPTDSLKRIAACANEANIKVSPFKLQCFINLTTRKDFPDGYDWGSESEVRPKIVNGFIYGYSRFSAFLLDKCEDKNTRLLADIKPNFSTIIMASDGLCGSSCAIVAAYLQQHKSPGIVFTQHNIISLPPNLFSFAGGQVVGFNNVKDVAIRSSCFDMIPDLLEKTQMTITYRAIFNMQDKKTPLEYYELPANYAFEYTLSYATSFAARWKDVFPVGMDIFKTNSFSYGYMTDDLAACEGSEMFC